MVPIAQLVLPVDVRVAALGEVGVSDGLLGGDAAGRVVDKEAVKQVETVVVEARNDGRNVGAVPLGERGLEVGEGSYAWPILFGGGAEDAGGVLARVMIGVWMTKGRTVTK